jgi:GT2 family glycosyltransferase
MFTQSCIESIRIYTPPHLYEIIVVDNGSTDGTVDWLRSQTDLKVIFNKENLGFPKGCNQGLAIADGDNLLLLNNDTIVTPRWLDQLLACLNSDDTIGAVGPVTNAASYYTAISVQYHTLEEMITFAEQYNRSDPSKWEERLKLIGFCMLFKREVFQRIGSLDERFSPGNFEDDDYCLRMRRAGYKVMICTDTFIHHEGSASFRNDVEAYHQLMQVNIKKFSEKWGFSPDYSLGIRLDLLHWIDEPETMSIRVLEVGCACGGTLLELRNWFPRAELYGIEMNAQAAEIAALVANVQQGNIELMELDVPHAHFDYIIFGDVLEHLAEPWSVLEKLYPYLTQDGKVLASIPNVGHYSVIRDLMKGRWNYTSKGLLDVTHLRFFTMESIYRLFTHTGFKSVEMRQHELEPSPEDEKWINAWTALTGEEMRSQWSAYQYIVKAHKSGILYKPLDSDVFAKLKKHLRRLEWDICPEESRSALINLVKQRSIYERDLVHILSNEIVDSKRIWHKFTELLAQEGLIDRDVNDINKFPFRKEIE